MNRLSKIIVMTFVMASVLTVTGCGSNNDNANKKNNATTNSSTNGSADINTGSNGSAGTDSNADAREVSLTVLAAASLTDVCDEIKTMYENEHSNVTVTFSYGGSGALQTQIEEGAPCDIFISAAEKQMNALNDGQLMDSDSIRKLLENKVVLIVPKDSDIDISSFEDVAGDKVNMIGLGEPGSVPVGQYSEEIFTNLGILDKVEAKANYGQDVRTVLSWVENSAVECGVVYATDAYTSDGVEIICEAPKDSCKRVIYPIGITAGSDEKEEAEKFIQYLESDEIMNIFESYGFSEYK